MHKWLLSLFVERASWPRLGLQVSDIFHPPLELFLSKRTHSCVDVQWQGFTNRMHHIAYEVRSPLQRTLSGCCPWMDTQAADGSCCAGL
mgnify:CR=1 FL=1